MTQSKWRAGSVVAERYRLEERIDRGALSEVWRAHHLQLSAPVAIKLTCTADLRDSVAVARLRREAQAGAALRGANVVQVLDYGTEDGDTYLVMEHLAGESLKARLETSGCLPPAAVAAMMTQVGRAVGRAHRQGIIHRDLKPANIFLAHEDAEETVKVLDFGAIKSMTMHLDVQASTETGAVIGTPYYMSPEQLKSSKHIDYRADLWALGIIAFQCLTGERPFAARNLFDLIVKVVTGPIPVPSSIAAVPAGFDAWFERATQRDPDKRFQSAAELSAALTTALGASD